MPSAKEPRTTLLLIRLLFSIFPMLLLCSCGVSAQGVSVSLSPTTLTWGSVAIGQTSGSKSFTITNNQSVVLTFSSISVPAGTDFLVQSTTCPVAPATLAASASCTVSMQFRPLASGTRTGTVTINDDAPGSPQTLALSATGTIGPTLFSPTSLGFAGVAPGSTTTQTVTLSNTTNAAITLTSIKASAGQFTQTNNCPLSPSTLAAGANCSLSITYKPTAASTTGTVTAAYSSPSTGSSQLYLSGSVDYVPITPATYNFGTVQQGAAGTSNTFTLTNNYTQALTISSISTTLTDYATSTTCPASPATLAVSQSCNITVTFTPSTTGTRNDTLTVAHNAPDSPTTAALTGVGVAPMGVTFSPTSVSYGNTQVGQTSASQTVTLTNNSGAALTINSVAFSSDFIQSSNTCVSSSPLAVGSSCTITSAYRPLATGNETGSITVTDSGPNSPQQVALSGTGVTGPVLFSPTSYAFPSTAVGSTSATQTVTLTNTQSTALTISSIAASTGFTQTNNCGATPATLAGNGTCTLTVAFKPTSTGSQTGTVNVNYGSGTQSLYLSGTATGTVSGSVTVSPKSYTFSSAAGNMNQAVGTTSAPVAITLTNGLSTALSISSIQIAAPFAQTNTCGTSVPSGQTCTINVTYSPTAVGYSSATLAITDSASNSPQNVAIAGNAVTAVALTPSTGGLGYYTQIVQTTSSSQTLTITNNLSTTLTFNSITSTADYPFTTGCVGAQGTGTLASQASCTVYVSFDPQATGSRPGTLSISESFDKNPLTVPFTGTGISGDLGPSVTVEPAGPCVPPSGTQQFSVTTYDPSNASVAWYVNGVLNGNATQGTISSSGLYTAPSSTGTRTITAKTQGSSPVSGTTTLSITTTPLFEIYPYTSSLPRGGQQTFQPQTCTVPDTLPVTFTVDGIAGGNTNVGTITSAGVYTAPATAGKHTVKVTDASINKSSGAVVTVFSAISADFGSRTSTTYPLQANLFGYGRGESIQTTEDRSLLTQAGITVSRLYAQIPLVYATGPNTPDWTKVDPLIASIQAAGQHVMLQVSQSPAFLQPTTGTCANNPAAAPTNNSQWAAIATAYVAHMDANFPGVVTDYEIWNEPNASGMCSSNNLNNYIALYAAAVPAMKQQAANDGATIRVGGPVLSGYSSTWINTLLTTASTYPYVDFISYHNYFFGGSQRQVEWDTYNGAPSLYQETTDPSNGGQEIYSKVYAAVAAGKQPSPTQTPIYVTEFNTNFAFAQDCCRNDPTYAPLWNALYVTDLLNSAYSGIPAPSKLVYFAGSAYPWFCLIGTADQNNDCQYSRGSTPQPYPQYYMYQLLSSSNYLGLSAGGYLAPTITPPTGGGGPVILAFYNASQDAIMITNPTSKTYSQLPVTLLNTGLTSPQATLYEIQSGTSIMQSSLTLTPSGTGYSTTVNIPPYSVMGISLKGQ